MYTYQSTYGMINILIRGILLSRDIVISWPTGDNLFTMIYRLARMGYSRIKSSGRILFLILLIVSPQGLHGKTHIHMKKCMAE
jgi:hypothetical protein